MRSSSPRFLGFRTVLLLGAVLGVVPVRAQDEVAGATRALPLEQVVVMALESNPDLQVTRIGVDQSQASIRTQKSPFDPSLTLDVFRNDRQNPTASELDGARVRQSDVRAANLDVTVPFRDGTSVLTRFGNQRDETNSTFAILNPNYTSNLLVRLTRPLLKNAGSGINTSRLRQARNERIRAEQEWVRVASETVAAVEQAYWDLVFALADVKVKDQAVEGARKLLEYNRRRQEIGVSSEVETLESESVLAARTEERLGSIKRARLAQQSLKALISYQRMGLDRVQPTDPPELDPKIPPLEEALEDAFSNRKEIARARLDIENKGIELKFQRNQKKPQIDFVGSYTHHGLGRVLSDAHEQVFDLEFPEWRLGVTFTVPLENHAGHGNYNRAREDLRQSRASLTALMNGIRREVGTALVSVASDRDRVAAAKRAAELAERKLEAEETRYEQGLISNFDLLRFQEDLSRARSRAVQSVTDLLKSMVELDRARGRILEERGIILLLDDPPIPRG